MDTPGGLMIVDWDSHTIALYGLDMTTAPAKVREALAKGLISTVAEEKVQGQLKSLAVSVYNHQKASTMFRAKVCDGKNTLAYHMCALFELTANSPEEGGRPKLRTLKALPLANWDLLYYALTAEIRQMYSELQQQYGSKFENGTVIIHNAGQDGTGGEVQRPVSAVHMAAMLENLWSTITDHRLVATLDQAVRNKHVRDIMAQTKQGEAGEEAANLPEGSQDAGKLSEAAEGLMDVNTMTPENIIIMVWHKQATDARYRLSKNIDEQSLLAACHAEVTSRASNAQDQPLPNHLFGALTNQAAQLQITAAATAGQEMRRTYTNESELAHMPPLRTPHRANKDLYPLGFYGNSSGQRYPTFPTNQHHDAPPVFGGPPVRKPVPTLGSSSPTSPSSTLPDTAISAEAYSTLADEAQDAVRPFSDDAKPLRKVKSRPRLLTSATMPGNIFSRKNKSTDNLPITNEPLPPLPPLPDFISPKPATKQRYVSAGGHAKLEDREEIAGPKFSHPNSGADTQKAELYAKLRNDPEYVKATFGAEAVAMAQKLSVERCSQEEPAVSPPAGLVKHEKRDRTGSASSSFGERLGRLKRVFSRKSGEGE
ncbi:hypothetical protein LTR08_008282 [Meristemomyces frigidus]|nr:hypothetical protein LTR08_008282 [Meristemomyces frigidus]